MINVIRAVEKYKLYAKVWWAWGNTSREQLEHDNRDLDRDEDGKGNGEYRDACIYDGIAYTANRYFLGGNQKRKVWRR